MDGVMLPRDAARAGPPATKEPARHDQQPGKATESRVPLTVARDADQPQDRSEDHGDDLVGEAIDHIVASVPPLSPSAAGCTPQAHPRRWCAMSAPDSGARVSIAKDPVHPGAFVITIERPRRVRRLWLSQDEAAQLHQPLARELPPVETRRTA